MSGNICSKLKLEGRKYFLLRWGREKPRSNCFLENFCGISSGQMISEVAPKYDQKVGKYRFKEHISSISWIGDSIVCGSNGSVLSFKVDPTQDPKEWELNPKEYKVPFKVLSSIAPFQQKECVIRHISWENTLFDKNQSSGHPSLGLKPLCSLRKRKFSYLEPRYIGNSHILL